MNKFDFFDILIDIDEITTNNLRSYGVSFYYITKFLNEKVIKRTNRGKYEVYNLNDLYSYGKRLIKERRFDKALKCLKKCLSYGMNDVRVYFQLIILDLYNKNYDDVLIYLDTLSKMNVLIDNERRYILYLLSNVTNMSDNYLDELDHVMFDFIRYNNSDDINQYKENKVRGFCFDRKFELAIDAQNRMHKTKKLSNYAIIHNILIEQSYEKSKKDSKILYDLIVNGDYISAKELLNKQINPSKYYIYVGKLLDELIMIVNSNKLSKTMMVDASNVFDAIDGKNYSLALTLSKNDNNILHLLLTKICNKIKENTNPNKKREKVLFNYFSTINKDNYFEVDKMINYIYKILSKNKGIYILDSFNNDTTYDLVNLLSLIPDFKISVIKFNLEKRIVIRYSSREHEEIEERNNLNYASFLYDYKHYEEALNICLDLLQNDNPSINIYILTAWVYLKLKDSKEARKYFMIAYSKSKNSDYLDIINAISSSYSKPMFHMSLDEFSDNVKKK